MRDIRAKRGDVASRDDIDGRANCRAYTADLRQIAITKAAFVPALFMSTRLELFDCGRAYREWCCC